MLWHGDEIESLDDVESAVDFRDDLWSYREGVDAAVTGLEPAWLRERAIELGLGGEVDADIQARRVMLAAIDEIEQAEAHAKLLEERLERARAAVLDAEERRMLDEAAGQWEEAERAAARRDSAQAHVAGIERAIERAEPTESLELLVESCYRERPWSCGRMPDSRHELAAMVAACRPVAAVCTHAGAA